jgi:hypothetical protein
VTAFGLADRPLPAFMKSSIQKSYNNKLTCPHCGRTYNAPRELAAHIRDKHADRLASRTAQSRAKKEKRANTVPVSVAVPRTDAHEHLKAALEELMQRNRQIAEELARREALQAEKEAIRKQIDAVNTALQAFVRMIGVVHDGNLDIKVAESREPEKLPSAATFVDKPVVVKSLGHRTVSIQRLKTIGHIIDKLGVRPTTRQMAQLLVREGFTVSHVQVFKDYRTLKNKS